MSDIERKLSRKMKELRGEMSQRDFARKVGLDRATVSNIENQKSNITLRTLQILCNRLRCNVGYLFGEED